MSLHTERKSEVDTKLARLRKRLVVGHIDDITLSMNANTAWITAGASMFVNEASDSSASSILVTMDRAYVLTDTIEAPRLRQEEGYPGAIEEHHQGGTLGYMPREVIAQPGDKTLIEHHQAFAWNPSLRGVKSEDTVLLGPNGPEILTEIADWPTLTITVNGQSIARPAILEDHSGAL